jgi:hypothetical protein
MEVIKDSKEKTLVIIQNIEGYINKVGGIG